MDAKEEVRARLSIEDVIGEYIPLKRAGRSFKGISPFTQEKTASFFVSPDKNIWHDFSSNQGGDIFAFIMQVEGLDFRGALELLARKAGVDLSQYDTRISKGAGELKQRIIAAHALAGRFYQNCLIQHQAALQYVREQRHFEKQTIVDFQLGYAPSDGQSLRQYLTQKGFRDDELVKAGLVSRTGRDIFRDRLVVALCDPQGQVVGFTGRIMRDIKGAPKYLNTPQTPAYDKSRHVYGLHLARDSIRREDAVIIVEGNLDVIASHQAGVRQVVATAGTALTEHHLKSLSRLTHTISLAFDGDRAGIAATERAIPIAYKMGIALGIVSLPDDVKDPDELIQRDPELWQKAVASPRPAVEWLIDRYAAQHDPRSAAGKRAISDACIQLLRTIDDPVEREHYIRYMADVTGASMDALQEKLTTAPRQPLKPIRNTTPSLEQSDPLEDSCLGLALLDDEVRKLMITIAPEAFVFPAAQELQRALRAGDLPTGQEYEKMVLFKAETQFGGMQANSRLSGAQEKIHILKKRWRDRQRQALSQQLAQMLDAGDAERARDIQASINQLNKEEFYG